MMNLGDRYTYNDSYINDINKNNKRIFLFYGNFKRFGSGETLLRGHIESFKKAKIYLEAFDYFCTIASNSLFVRKFSLENVVDTFKFAVKDPISTERSYQMDINVDKDFNNFIFPDRWPWEGIVNNNEMKTTLKEILDVDKYHISQIEGMFCSYNAWNYISSLDSKIKNIAYTTKQPFLPLEEMIPSSILFEKFPNENTNICYMLWNGGRKVDLNFLCEAVPFLPQHLCLIKWFERRPYDTAINFINSDISDNLFSIIKNLISDKKSFFFKDYLFSYFNKNIINENMRKEAEYLFPRNNSLTFNYLIKEKLKIYSLHKDFFIHSERFEGEINSIIMYKKEKNKYIFNLNFKTMSMTRHYGIVSYLYIDISHLKFIKIFFEKEVNIEKFVLFLNKNYIDMKKNVFKKINNNLYSIDLYYMNVQPFDTYFLGIPIEANMDMRFCIDF